MSNKIRTITLWQPWAQLCVLGEKRVETRGYKTNVRGRIAIHAAKKNCKSLIMSLAPEEISLFTDIVSLSQLPYGAVIGTVEVIDCVLLPELAGTEFDTPKEHAFGNWSEGRWGWILDNPILFKEPIPAKGSQGFWYWSNEQKIIGQEV